VTITFVFTIGLFSLEKYKRKEKVIGAYLEEEDIRHNDNKK